MVNYRRQSVGWSVFLILANVCSPACATQKLAEFRRVVIADKANAV
jgi:hypothetical protein